MMEGTTDFPLTQFLVPDKTALSQYQGIPFSFPLKPYKIKVFKAL